MAATVFRRAVDHLQHVVMVERAEVARDGLASQRTIPEQCKLLVAYFMCVGGVGAAFSPLLEPQAQRRPPPPQRSALALQAQCAGGGRTFFD